MPGRTEPAAVWLTKPKVTPSFSCGTCVSDKKLTVVRTRLCPILVEFGLLATQRIVRRGVKLVSAHLDLHLLDHLADQKTPHELECE